MCAREKMVSRCHCGLPAGAQCVQVREQKHVCMHACKSVRVSQHLPARGVVGVARLVQQPSENQLDMHATV
jgi:hypothetical protein